MGRGGNPTAFLFVERSAGPDGYENVNEDEDELINRHRLVEQPDSLALQAFSVSPCFRGLPPGMAFATSLPAW